jgi:hypothetical protein
MKINFRAQHALPVCIRVTYPERATFFFEIDLAAETGAVPTSFTPEI